MKRLYLVLIFVLLLPACRKNPPRVDLGVDVYLHPESARIEDVILQAAIRKKLMETPSLNAGLVHVRVIDGFVFLSGSVASAGERAKVAELARAVDVRVDGKPIKPADVRIDGLLVEQ